MRGVGTLVNLGTVALGTLVGVAVGSRIPERVRSTALQVVGLTTLVIGMKEALGTRNVVFPLVALIIGGAAGELLRVEERLEAVGDRIRRRVERDGAGEPSTHRFVEGFVAASVLFCVGPLTFLGSIRDGLGGPDHAQLLLVKSALDGLVAVVFASTLGWGVGFSVLTIAVVQGSLTLGAGTVDSVLTSRMVTEMTAAGGVMILGIGLRLLDVKRVPVASLLPALV
ncbi:MAG: DUF554 domain-containing protein, partial [Actinomycetota bacterium]|nr:DUF554 domain-containing protein [Actinomycetota bacterium]